MKFPTLHSHRFALEIIEQTDELRLLWGELIEAVTSISDDELIQTFERIQMERGQRATRGFHAGQGDDSTGSIASSTGEGMSLSAAINALLRERLIKSGWQAESALFQGDEYRDNRWKLDFSKMVTLPNSEERLSAPTRSGMAVEVAFNHGEAIAWNLLKPVLASELNHVLKQVDVGAGVGVIITASKELKSAGAFDGAVGEYEKFLRYLAPMRNQLTVPLVIVGLPAPESFRIKKIRDETTRKNKGVVVKF